MTEQELDYLGKGEAGSKGDLVEIYTYLFQ